MQELLEIAFRLTELDDGQVRVDCRIGAAENQGLLSGWSHMVTAPNMHAAASDCASEILCQSASRAVDAHIDSISEHPKP